MGGNALSVPSKRISPTEYVATEKYIVDLFALNGIKIYTINQIANKESFGDLDVVVDIEAGRELIEAIINGVSDELVKNCDVWSFGLDGFQVDIVFSNCPEYTASWMAYSDASNLVGRLAHRIGLKHGHLGLYLPLREDTKVVGNVMLSHDIDDIHTLIALDPDKWHTGFTTREEIYEWVTTSPFYTPDIFLLDNRNAKARYRDSKRPTYMGMLEWITKQPSKEYPSRKPKEEYLPMIFDYFPSSKAKYDKLIEVAKHRADIREAYNEKLPTSYLMEISGLQLKEFGAYITSLKALIGDSVLVLQTEHLKEIAQHHLKDNYGLLPS